MFGALPLGEWLHLERWEVRAACSLSIQRIIHGICSGARCRAETGRRSSPSRRRGSKSCGAQSDEACTFRMQRWSSDTLDGPEIFAKSGSSLGGDEGSLHALLARGLVAGKVTGVAGAGGSRSNRRSAPAHSFLLASRLSHFRRAHDRRSTDLGLDRRWGCLQISQKGQHFAFDQAGSGHACVELETGVGGPTVLQAPMAA